MYMLVYLWAQNPRLITPREELPARKPMLPAAGAKCRAGPCPPHPYRRGSTFWGCGRARDLTRTCQPLQEEGEGLRPRAQLHPSLFLLGVHADTQTQVGPGHSHARPSRGNTPSAEGRGRERNGKRAFFSAFLCLCLGKTSSAKS